jgi:ribosomal protein L11 methyltransferase
MAGRLSAEPPEALPGAVADGGAQAADRSVRVTVPAPLAEEAGAILMDVLGPFEEERPAGSLSGAQADGKLVLVFYPSTDGPSTREEVLALLPPEFAEPDALLVETCSVSRDWVEGWRDHFRPIVIGAVRIRPPWEPPPEGDPSLPGTLMDVMINPGLGFGTGLHPTTRGTLRLLQDDPLVGGAASGPGGRGRLVDVGTGSGILSVAAAKLGWFPVVAMDNDPVALVSARENVTENGVQDAVSIYEADTDSAQETWFADATVLANMTLEPVSLLLQRLATMTARPRRLVVSGILAGSQEEQITLIAHDAGFAPGRRIYEGEWVSFELLPDRSEA